jgi:formamidopyrimidine-DNA glycosylase
LRPPERPAHTRVTFALGDGELMFVDPRRFGTGELALGPEALDAFFAARLGIEPFEPEFTGAHLHAIAKRCRAPIKAMLLDQKRIAGVGNIYADEALFRAQVHPLRRADALTRRQCDAVRDAVVASLEAGIEAKGATIDDFRDPDGARGSFQDQFLVHLRAGEPCPVCGTAVVKLRAAGRGTYVCPRCQRGPRRYAAAASSRSMPARSARTSS